MQKYEVVAPFVLFYAGALQLTAVQALARKASLTQTKAKDIYLIDSPVGFKRGETIGFDGEIDRSLLLALTGKPGKGSQKNLPKLDVELPEEIQENESPGGTDVE